MALVKGDRCIYKGQVYAIEDVVIQPSVYLGQIDWYNLRAQDGTIVLSVSEFDIIPYYMPTAKSNLCECGAHITFIPTSHSEWCPMFRPY